MPANFGRTPFVVKGGPCTYKYEQQDATGATSCRITWSGVAGPSQLTSPLAATYTANSLLSFPNAVPIVCKLDLASKTFDPEASSCV